MKDSVDESLKSKLVIKICGAFFYLDVLLDDLSAHQDTSLWQVDPGQGDERFTDDLITRESIKAQHHEVKSQLWHSSQRNPIEGEGLVKGWVQSLPKYSGLNPVFFLWQQGELDVGVRGQRLLISWGQAMGFLRSDK